MGKTSGKGNWNMVRFPEQLFADVRTEEVFSTALTYVDGAWEVNRVRREKGALLRVYDGRMWYYAATTDLDRIQEELDGLAALASPNPDILADPVVRRLQANRDRVMRYEGRRETDVPHARKEELVRHCHDLVAAQEGVAVATVRLADEYRVKHVVSSLGCDVAWDYQSCGLRAQFTLKVGDAPLTESKTFYASHFDDLNVTDEAILADYRRALDFAKRAVPVKPGRYPVILSPEVAGVFAHESFGHKSESDFMLGDESMMREWALGTKVGSDILSIYDDGGEPGSGYLPYDDEGVRKTRSWLIRDGVLAGRLHCAATAAALDEGDTGNARAVSFEFEPIVRMTSTCIGPGKQTREELLAGVKEGVYIHDYTYGTGMSTFTIAPTMAWMIRDGRLAEPVRVSVISGSVMDTLHLIDGLSDQVEVTSSVFGGCGKMEQFPLRVSFGGPYVRVSAMNVQ